MSAAVQSSTPGLGENRRYASRHALRLGSTLTASGVEIVIHDISATGMLVETAQQLSLGETLTLDLPERGATTATVTWASGRFHGCEFVWSLPAATVSAALLKSAPLAGTAAPAGGADIAALQSLLEEAESDQQAAPDDRYSLRTRGTVILGGTVLLWAVIGGLLTLI